MKQGWIQSNTNGVYEDVAPKTLADLVYMDGSQSQTVKQALDSLGTGPSNDLTENTYYGNLAGESAKGHGGGFGNTYIGSRAGQNDPTGDFNTYVGKGAGEHIGNGMGNTVVGADAGIMVGGSGPAIASDSIYIGAHNQSGEWTGLVENEIVIGNGIQGSGSNTITLGNWNTQQLFCQSTVISIMSDRRVKEEIQPANVDICVEAIKNLPVTRYKYKDFTGKHLDTHVTGFLADDVEKVFPKSVTKGNRYFPVLDENGEQVYEEVEETVVEADENGQPVSKVVTRKVPQMFLMTDVKDLTMTEAVPTLWGAMQALIARLEALEGK